MGRVQLNVWLDEADRDHLRTLAEQRGVSIGHLVREAVQVSRPSEPDPLARDVGRIADSVTLLSEGLGETQGLAEELDRRVSKLEEMAHGGF